MLKSMAARTTDHNGRIMVVNRKEKKLPKYPSSNVVGISDGETIKYVPPTDTVASKLNAFMMKNKKDAGKIVVVDSEELDDSPDEDEKAAD